VDSKWREHFEAELADGNFVRGGKHLLMNGEGANLAHEQWAACLALINMPIYFTDPKSMLRRHRDQYVRGETDQRKAEYDDAECVFIAEFFSGPYEYDTKDKDDLTWLLTQLINDGTTLVISTDADEDTTGLYQYEPIGNIIEQHFEAVNGTATKKRKIKTKNSDK
jgi:hypothetical protein